MEQFTCWDDIPLEYRMQLDRSGNLLVDPLFLRFTEQAGALPCRYRYFAFADEGRLVAFFPGMLLGVNYDDFCGPSTALAVAALRRLRKDLFRYPTLEVGSPVVTGESRFLDDGLGDDDLRRLVGEVLAEGRRSGIRLILFRDFQGPKTPFERILEEKGFVRLANLPTTRLTIDFDSFEEYLEGFSAARRRNIRRKRKLIAEKGIRRVAGSRLLEEPEVYRRLYDEVRSRAVPPGRERLTESYFRSLAANLPENSTLIHYYRGGELIAFVSLLHKGERLYSLYIGMDYAEAQEAALYFNAYFDQIEYALAQGIRTIDAGMTTYEPKIRHGFELVPQRMYAWSDSRLLRRRLVSFFAGLPSVS